MTNFEKRVFINCPFDDEYRQMLLALVFTVKSLGYEPRLSLQFSDSSNTRLENIVSLIETSKFGIHDLSRILSGKKGEPVRMNMPFELGIDYACKRFKGNEANSKKILILEAEKYRYQAALSDLSGSDIRHHSNDPLEVVKAVRDWFITEEKGKGPAPSKIWYDFNDFNSDLEDQLTSHGYQHHELDKVPIPEIMTYMDEWFTKE